MINTIQLNQQQQAEIQIHTLLHRPTSFHQYTPLEAISVKGEQLLPNRILLNMSFPTTKITFHIYSYQHCTHKMKSHSSPVIQHLRLQLLLIIPS